MKKIKNIILILLIAITITSCGSKNEETKKEEEKIVTEDIKTGVVDGYKFTQVEEETDRVKIQMENGDIILVVLSNKDTPLTINNFKKLVSEKFYDGLIFHRVIKDFMVQGGDPTGTGFEGSDEEIKGEFSSNGVKNSLSHTRGVVSMARSNDPDSASSQFFICHADSTYLDGNYAAFGKVFAGMDIVDKIANVETNANDKPLTEQKMHSIRFITVEKE